MEDEAGRGTAAAEAESEFRRACALGTGGDSAGAEQAMRSLLDRHPSHRGAAATLASVLAESGRPNAAADVVLKSQQHGAFDEVEAAEFLRRCQRFDDAYRLCLHALEQRPGAPRLASMAGTIALNLGRFDEAGMHLRSAVRLDPGDAGAWLRIARTKRFSDPADPDLLLLEAGAREQGFAPVVKEAIGFALGKARDDLKRYHDAAQVFAAANASFRARQPWQAVDARAVTSLQRRIESLPLSVDSGFQPVFVVGMPRSGTTLVASLLARHFGARNRGETPWVGEAFRRFGQELGDVRMRRAAAQFIERQLRQDDAPARFHVDKNPLNFLHARLILALFPQAKLIWMHRSARDTALSLWMQHFAHAEMGFAYAWTDIAASLRNHAEAVADSRDIAAASLLHLRYEDVAHAPDDALRRLTAFLGADPVVEAPSADGAIATASLWQARQPVYTNSVGRWRHYRDAVPELEQLFDD